MSFLLSADFQINDFACNNAVTKRRRLVYGAASSKLGRGGCWKWVNVVRRESVGDVIFSRIGVVILRS